MRKIIFLSGLLFMQLSLYAQPVIERKLDQLHKPVTFTNKYVNFDVLKLMVGPGWSNLQHPLPAISIEFQFLAPVALLKEWRVFHIAYGLSLGHSPISQKNTEFIFSHSSLTGVVDNSQIRKSVQKVRYVGLVLMPFWQFRNFQIMTGVSPHFNILNNVLKIYSASDKVKLHDSEFLNRISVPLLLQISFSRRQLWSCGPFASYDIRSRFKGDFKNVKQLTVGFGAGIRI